MTDIFSAPRRLALLVWILGLALSALAGWMVHANNDTLLRARFEALTDEFKRLIVERFDLYPYGCVALVARLSLPAAKP